MPEDQDLDALWVATQARLPEGWSLDGLRCASTGLAPAERSDDWVAVATGPDGEERSALAGTPGEALEALAAGLESEGSATGRSARPG
jgi:hypothetical protein